MEPTLVNKELKKPVERPKAAPPVYPAPPIRIRTGTISNFSFIALAVLSISLLASFFFPLWNIYLGAPQYPEGLSMHIWINKLTGDLSIINDLNHYIGMKFIKPEDFSELTYMPYLVGFLIAFGLISALSRKKYMLYIFALLIIGLGITGAIDFYMWEYNYGHQLDPHAAIQVPGMTYQPPMIGTKQLLNFTATSWPALGGIAIIVAALGSLALSIFELRRKFIIR